MIIKKPIKLTAKKLSNLTTVAITLIILTILIFTSLFLYKNFYQTITQTQEIMILQEKVAIDSVNMQKFDLIMDRLTKKTTSKELKNVISPFR